MSKRISLQGAADEDVARLRELLNRPSADLQSDWKFHAGADADLLVIDIDTVYGHMDWLRVHNGSTPVAVFTEHTQFADADLILHKPLTSANLVDILNRVDPLINDRHESEFTPDSVAPDSIAPAPVAPKVPPARFATPLRPSAPAKPVASVAAAPVVAAAPAAPRERRLSDWLSDGALSAPARLSDDGVAELILDPANKIFFADGSLRALAAYCARVVTREQWQDVAPAKLSELQAGGKGQPYPRLLWLCHVLGSNGQLSSGLDVNAKYKLARWPQIEREFPKHFRIATVMLKQLATLTEIADLSGAPLTEVIDFTNAYNATGYIEIEGSAGSAEPVTRDSGRHAILARLRNPFGGG
jgi:hypothetical protein